MGTLGLNAPQRQTPVLQITPAGGKQPAPGYRQFVVFCTIRTAAARHLAVAGRMSKECSNDESPKQSDDSGFALRRSFDIRISTFALVRRVATAATIYSIFKILTNFSGAVLRYHL